MSHAVSDRVEVRDAGEECERLPRGPRTRFLAPAAWTTAYLAVLLVLAWSRTLQSSYLFGAALAGAAAAALVWQRRFGVFSGAAGHSAGLRSPARPLYGALGIVAVALATGWLTEQRLERIASDWDELIATSRVRLASELGERMAGVVARGRQAAEQAAARAAQPSPRGLFADLAEQLAESGRDVTALAVFDARGELIAWAGDHRGAFPPAVQVGGARVAYAERPLFSYLYFAHPVEARVERAVATVLLQTGLTGLPLPRGESAGVAHRFAEETEARPRFVKGAGADASWSLVADGDTIVHAHFDAERQAAWRAAVVLVGQRATVALAATALLLLLLAWQWTGRAAHPAVPLLTGAAALAVAPLGAVLGVERLFSPAFFLLPGPGDLTLGQLAAVLLPLGALAAAAAAPPLGARRIRIAVPLGALAVAVGFVGGLRLLLSGTGQQLLEGGILLWGGLQLTLVLLLTIVAALALPWEGPHADQETAQPVRPLLLATGLALALALALMVLARWEVGQRIEPWMPALWAAPFALVAVGLASCAGRGGRILRWLVAGCLAASVVLPHLWVAHVDARLRAAEREVATLGTRTDPFLDYMLGRFAAEAVERSARGERPVDLLYRSWVASGLAEEAYPARLTLWNAAGEPEVQLGTNVGADGTDAAEAAERPAHWPASIETLFRRARASGRPVMEAMRDVPGINQVMVVPLPEDRLVSVIVPPRRTLDRAGGLAPLLGAAPGAETRLTLMPARLDDAPRSPGTTQWWRTDRGWRSDTPVRYPEGPYHAYLDVRFPGAGVRLARGMLLLTLDLGLLALLWVIGRAAGGDLPTPPGGWTGWLGSFRARVTLALFAFFLIPTVLFGAVAYQALAGEVTRATQLVAERAARQAVSEWEDADGDLAVLSARTGEEVLYYHRGELAGASSPEAFELGIHSAWMPPNVYQRLQSGEQMSTVEMRELARRPYLIAYRPLPVAGTLAVPVSLTAGDTALRQQELAHLVLFAALIGGLLSLALSVAVGRALARPIGRLGRAATSVGAGRLSVRLPENRADEFGVLFASFNRMVRRLRRARAQELRTARVLAWGEMARQVAHEIKNPLTPIKLSVQHLRRAYADRRPDFGAILDSNVQQILREIDRLTEITRVFSRYGAPAAEAGALEAVNVAVVIREALTLYRAGESDIEYREDVEPDLPLAQARSGELKDVLLNLLENARTALDGQGLIEVSARRMEQHVEVVVCDDGAGIPREVLSRIFEPRFSTRSGGTGLGLAIVRRLIESWQAQVAVESELGHGTTVRVKMQIAEGP